MVLSMIPRARRYRGHLLVRFPRPRFRHSSRRIGSVVTSKSAARFADPSIRTLQLRANGNVRGSGSPIPKQSQPARHQYHAGWQPRLSESLGPANRVRGFDGPLTAS